MVQGEASKGAPRTRACQESGFVHLDPCDPSYSRTRIPVEPPDRKGSPLKSLVAAVVLLSASAVPAMAQGVCGWDEFAAPDHLPKFVETVIAQLPASWADGDKTVANLRK